MDIGIGIEWIDPLTVEIHELHESFCTTIANGFGVEMTLVVDDGHNQFFRHIVGFAVIFLFLGKNVDT